MNKLPLDLTDNLLLYPAGAIVINILLAFGIGMVVSMVYRSTHQGLSYSQSFCQTIVYVTVIVAIVMMVVAGNLARAFALVGAMSIIRFRTVLKDTKDMAYVFGALALGMAAGIGNYFLAVLGTTVVTAMAIILYKLNYGAVSRNEFILRFRHQERGGSEPYMDIFRKFCRTSKLLNMEPSGDNQSLSLTYDITLKREDHAKELTRLIGGVEGVSEVVLIASQNDVDY